MNQAAGLPPNGHHRLEAPAPHDQEKRTLTPINCNTLPQVGIERKEGESKTHPVQEELREEQGRRSRASRSKIKCKFGPNSKQRETSRGALSSTRDTNGPERGDTHDSDEIEELLREIDRARREDHSPDLPL